MKLAIISCLLVLACLPAFTAAGPRLTLNFLEYNRGFSLPTSGSLHLTYGNNQATFHHLHLDDQSYFPDGCLLPNAFLYPLFEGNFSQALKSFTEPYYGYRFYHFFRKKPNWGIGIDFIHLKVSLIDRKQRVRLSGTWNGESVDGEVIAGDYLSRFDVSHGVNHLSLVLVYRWMLQRSEALPDGRIQPFVSCALGPCIPHLELDVAEKGQVSKKAYSYQFRFPNLGFGLYAGVRFKLRRHFGLYLEYKFTYSYLHGMIFDNGQEGKVQIAFVDHHLQWGVSYIL